MIAVERFRPSIVGADQSATEGLGQPNRNTRWIMPLTNTLVFASSGSTPGYGNLIFWSNWTNYNIHDSIEENEGMTFYMRTSNEQTIHLGPVIDIDKESELDEMYLSLEGITGVGTTSNDNHSSTNTGLNIHRADYEEPTTNETASKVAELTYLIKLEPIEDGYFHPAETLIEESLNSSTFDPNHWVYTVYFRNIDREPALAAGVLRLLSRFPHSQIGEWGIVIAVHGLSQRDIEVRDAAVRALERWGGHRAFQALKAHVDIEPMPWLAAYIRQVLIDLDD